MLNSIRTSLIWLAPLASVAMVPSVSAAGEPFFERVPGLWTAISTDGEVAARPGFRWVHGQGATQLPRGCATCSTIGQVSGMSWDGNTIAYITRTPNGATNQQGVSVWTAAGGTVFLDPAVVGGYVFSVAGMSPDGRFVLGAARPQPTGTLRMMRWSRSGGIEYLHDTTLGGREAVDSSYDGSSIIGYATGTNALLWREGAGLSVLPVGAGVAVPLACSSDASVVVGRNLAGTANVCWRWTVEHGVQELVAPIGMSGSHTPFDVSADGRIVVGRVGTTSLYYAVIWEAASGVRLLRDVVTERLGSDPGHLGEARAISADGRTIAGDGFIVRFPAYCAGDVDDGTLTGARDGAVTVDDLIAFLRWLELNDVRADLDNALGTGVPDAAVTIDDMIYFLDGYTAGC